MILQQTRGLLSSNDQLALDLPFAATKSLSARIGPTPTFTRGSSATFVGSNGLIQTAAVNAARFDHDPANPTICRGLLIEDGRTNNVLRSEEFSDAYWAKSRVTVTANATTSPDGATTADKIVETATSLDHNIGRLNISLSPQQTLTYSVFVKSAERSEIRLRMQQNVNGVDCIFNLSTLAITPVNFGSGSGSTGSIVAYPNGWYRCAITGRPSGGTGTTLNVANFIVVSGNVNYTGDGTSGIFIWGAQLEEGSFPTSYIPTTTSALARSADVCSITGANFANMWSASEGTMLVDSFTPASGDRTVVAADDDTSNEMIRLRTEGTNPFFKVTDGGSELVAIDSGTVVANTAFKLAGAYKLNDFASSINGGVVVTDTTGTVPTVDRMRIGAGQGGNTMCGCVSSLRYYKKRLPNAKLQALTV